MRSENSAYLPIQVAYPFQGVDYLAPSTEINPAFFSEMSNVDTTLGHITKRRGYTALGGAVDGIVLALVEFKDISSVSHFVLITTTREYKWSGSAWTDITYTDTVGPTVHPRTGSEDNGIDWTVVTGKDSTGAIVTWLIITNGVDKPRYWDGSLATFYEYSTASVATHGAALTYPNFVTCKCFGSLNSYLVLGNVTTTANEPNVVVWSDTQSLTDFISNNAAADLLVDAVGSILRILPLGDRLVVYAEDTIHTMLHIGGDDIFSLEKIVGGTRLLSGRAIVDVGPWHYFMSQENILLFDGTRGLRRMADKITVRYRDILLSDLKTRAFAFLDQPKNMIFFTVPTSSSLSTVFRMEFSLFDVEAIRWDVHTYANRVTAMGYFSAPATDTWDLSGDTLTWDQDGGYWVQGSTNKGFPKRVLGHSALATLSDDVYFTDNGTTIDASFESMDYAIPKDHISDFSRWTEIEFEARGSTVTVSVSYDKGSTYTAIESITLDGNWTRYRVFFDSVSQTARIKFSNSDAQSGFQIRWHKIWYAFAGSDD
jgi:hypothetical protein